MLLCSVKMKKTAVILLIGILFTAAVGLLLQKLCSSDHVTVGEDQLSLCVKSEEEVREFLSLCGCEADELKLKREIVIPENPDETYRAYLMLQSAQGFPLERYSGKPATEYIFSVLNSEMYVEALVSFDTVIASHLSSMDGSKDIMPLIDGM